MTGSFSLLFSFVHSVVFYIQCMIMKSSVNIDVSKDSSSYFEVS